MKKRKVYLSKECVFNESKKYKMLCDFKKNSRIAYEISLKNKWIDEMFWLERKKRKNGYWYIKENAIEESKKYCSRSEFQKHCVGAYQVSRKNGWLDEMTWLVKKYNNYETNNCVYAYVDEESNVAYVGRTCNLKNRHSQHISEYNKSSVRDYFNNIGKDIPKPLCLEENLSLLQSQIKEDEWRKKYVELGFTMLNKAKTGLGSGSLGTLSVKWKKDKVFDESKKYQSKSDFANGSCSAYNVARKNGWLNEMFWLTQKIKPNGYWNKERVFEESKKYKSKKEFENGCQTAYQKARVNKWLCEMLWLKRPKRKLIWTKEKVLQEALKYNNSYEFSLKCSGAYNSAKNNGWTKELKYKNDF